MTAASTSYTLGATTQPWGGIYTAKNVDWGLSGGQFAGRLNKDGSVQMKNMTGLSELQETPTDGLIAMFGGAYYYYSSGAWYMFNITQRNPPA